MMLTIFPREVYGQPHEHAVDIRLILLLFRRLLNKVGGAIDTRLIYSTVMQKAVK